MQRIISKHYINLLQNMLVYQLGQPHKWPILYSSFQWIIGMKISILLSLVQNEELITKKMTKI